MVATLLCSKVSYEGGGIVINAEVIVVSDNEGREGSSSPIDVDVRSFTRNTLSQEKENGELETNAGQTKEEIVQETGNGKNEDEFSPLQFSSRGLTITDHCAQSYPSDTGNLIRNSNFDSGLSYCL